MSYLAPRGKLRRLFIVLSCLVLAQNGLAATYTVLNTNDAGPGSFRQAILDANNPPTTGINRVHFNISDSGVQILAPLSPWPPIYESVVIDGYTQPGSMTNTLSNGFNARLLVQLNGGNSGTGTVGLSLLGHNSTVRGLNIVGFTGGGIRVLGAHSNMITGNLLGVDSNGAAFGNGRSADLDDSDHPGILLLDSIGSIVGGVGTGARNVVCDSGTDAIQVQGAIAAGNQVLGNFIGVDPTGQAGIGNAGAGVRLTGRNHVVGGTQAGARNFIALNSDGVVVSDGISNRIQGNFIGADVTGTNLLGNGSGIVLLDSQGCLIGGTNAPARNVIVANGRGVAVIGPAIGRNTIQGNSIGIDASGRFQMGNGSFGIRLEATSTNLIGGTNAGMGNIIAFNFGHGVEISEGIQNAILRNSIFGHIGLGIDLEGDGLTGNDPGDADEGANRGQNFPELTSAHTQSERAIIVGALDSLPSRSYRIQFFVSDECNPDSVGGKTYLTNITVLTDAAGRAVVRCTNDTALATGSFVSATATDPENNTSEFAPCVRVVPVDSVDLGLTLSESHDPAPLSLDLIYEIEVRNGGPTNATSVVVSNRLPANASFVSATSSQGSCSNAAGFVICRLNTLARDAAANIILTVRPVHGGLGTNFVSIISNQLESNPSDNAVSEFTEFGVADLEAVLSPSSNSVLFGNQLIYSMTITNYGPDPATELVASTYLPDGLVFVSASVPESACSLLDHTVVCNLASLNAGDGTVATIVVLPAGPGFYQTEAIIQASANDPDPFNNVGIGSVLVISTEPPTLSFRFDGGELFLEWPDGTLEPFLLETTTKLTDPIHWEIIPDATSPFAVTNMSGDFSRFYRIRMP